MAIFGQCSKVVVSIYLIAKVQNRGQKVAIYSATDVSLKSQYHSINDEPFKLVKIFCNVHDL